MTLIEIAENVFISCIGLIRKIKRKYKKKHHFELDFWEREIENYVLWYSGKVSALYGIPSPAEDIRIDGFSLKENAIRTWAQADIDKYPSRLLVSRDHFRGKRILDIGCGPIPYMLAFTHCEIYGMDQLVDKYVKLGFPLSEYSEKLTYVQGNAESLPFEDGFFDAVISVNALDHVDDFPSVAKEILRVLHPEGEVRIEVHYHEPSTCEPWALNDGIIVKHFSRLRIKKIHERLYTELYTDAPEKGEKLAVWANRYSWSAK